MSEFRSYQGNVPSDVGLPGSQYRGSANTCSNCSRLPLTNREGEPTCDGQSPCKTCKWEGDTFCKYPDSLLPGVSVPPHVTHPTPPRRYKRSSASSSSQATKVPRIRPCDSCKSRKIRCVVTELGASCKSCDQRGQKCTLGDDRTGDKTAGPVRKSLRYQKVCDPCKSSKYKCDETRPVCGRCFTSGKSSVCVYPNGPRDDGVTRNPGQNFGTDQQSELAETNISPTNVPVKGSTLADIAMKTALVGDWQPQTPGPSGNPGDLLDSFFE